MFSHPATAFAGGPLSYVNLFDGTCDHGLHNQPNGPMAIFHFCEDALGTHIGLVYYDRMGAPLPSDFYSKLADDEKKTYYTVWSLANRMWQDPIWASDVTSYAWSPKGTLLYVATSHVYGSGALYELDLVRHKYRQLAPKSNTANLTEPGPGYQIIGLSEDKSTLSYRLMRITQSGEIAPTDIFTEPIN